MEGLFGVKEEEYQPPPSLLPPPPSSHDILEACEKQDWETLRVLVPLPNLNMPKPVLTPEEATLERRKAARSGRGSKQPTMSGVNLFGAAVAAAGTAASNAATAANTAASTASSMAGNPTLNSGGVTGAEGSLGADGSGGVGGVGGEGGGGSRVVVDDVFADPDTGMTALHWIARHGRVGEADYIAPIVALRVEALAAKACRIAEDEARAVGRSGDGKGGGLSPGEVAAAGQAAAAATRQRLNKDLGSDELGLWRDSTGAVPLHHLAYNPTAARDATTAQEMVAEVTKKNQSN